MKKSNIPLNLPRPRDNMPKELPKFPENVLEGLRNISQEKRRKDPLGLEYAPGSGAFREGPEVSSDTDSEMGADPPSCTTPKRLCKSTGPDKRQQDQETRTLRSASKPGPSASKGKHPRPPKTPKAPPHTTAYQHERDEESPITKHTSPTPATDLPAADSSVTSGGPSQEPQQPRSPPELIDEAMETEEKDAPPNPQETFTLALPEIFNPCDLPDGPPTAAHISVMHTAATCMEALLGKGFAKDISSEVSEQGIAMYYTRILPTLTDEPEVSPPKHTADPETAPPKPAGPKTTQTPPGHPPQTQSKPGQTCSPHNVEEYGARLAYDKLKTMIISVPSRSPGQLLSVHMSSLHLNWSTIWNRLKEFQRAHWFTQPTSDPAEMLAFCVWACQVDSLVNTISPLTLRNAIKGAPV